MTVLVAGGAGYIGSHTCVELQKAGYKIVLLDNFSNSKPVIIDRIKKITGQDYETVKGDLRDEAFLDTVFSRYDIGLVIHFAGLKAVGESIKTPLDYYENNVGGTISLCKAMNRAGCKKMIFSSSATVYGDRNEPPFIEDMPLSAINPYGSTKLVIERILTDLCASDNEWSVVLLRYFNPVGAHESGLIGDDPQVPFNIVPILMKVSTGKYDKFKVCGNDYPTPDGTCVRDYIHITDLVKGHLAAIKALDKPGANVYNLGTGHGSSVMEVIKAYSKACGKEIPYELAPRRAGDAPFSFANASKAKRELGWQAELGLDRMCVDSWRFVQMNPDGII